MGAIITLTCPLTLPSAGQINTGAVTETALLSAPSLHSPPHYSSQLAGSDGSAALLDTLNVQKSPKLK